MEGFARDRRDRPEGITKDVLQHVGENHGVKSRSDTTIKLVIDKE